MLTLRARAAQTTSPSPEERVLLTEGSSSEPYGPKEWEQGNDGGHRYGHEGGPGYGGALVGSCYIDGAYGLVA